MSRKLFSICKPPLLSLPSVPIGLRLSAVSSTLVRLCVVLHCFVVSLHDLYGLLLRWPLSELLCLLPLSTQLLGDVPVLPSIQRLQLVVQTRMTTVWRDPSLLAPDDSGGRLSPSVSSVIFQTFSTSTIICKVNQSPASRQLSVQLLDLSHVGLHRCQGAYIKHNAGCTENTP